MKKALLAGLVLIAGNGIVVTAATSGEAVAQTQEKASGDERIVCRRDSAVGSRLGSRICLTRSQWRAREVAERERTRDIQDQAEREGREGYMGGGEGATSIAPN